MPADATVDSRKAGGLQASSKAHIPEFRCDAVDRYEPQLATTIVLDIELRRKGDSVARLHYPTLLLAFRHILCMGHVIIHPLVRVALFLLSAAFFVCQPPRRNVTGNAIAHEAAVGAMLENLDATIVLTVALIGRIHRTHVGITQPAPLPGRTLPADPTPNSFPIPCSILHKQPTLLVAVTCLEAEVRIKARANTGWGCRMTSNRSTAAFATYVARILYNALYYWQCWSLWWRRSVSYGQSAA